MLDKVKHTGIVELNGQEHIHQCQSQGQKEFNLSYIIITHDLSVAANLCDDIAVMFQGQIVEHGIATEIFNNPKHYYTQQMMKIYHHFNSTNLQ